MMTQISLSPSEILAEAIELIGYEPVSQRPDRSGWVTFWCPFHDDISRKGHSGRPNFRLHTETGGFTCFVCGRKGGSLKMLAKELGKDYVPRVPDEKQQHFHYPCHETYVGLLAEAVDECRANYLHSQAKVYVRDRGIKPLISFIYGLGYGLQNPMVSHPTYQAALDSGLAWKSGVWQWAESIVYADPPNGNATVINCRYLPDQYLNQPRPFKISQNHHTWGNRLVPLGSWRITPSTTMIIIVEGFFDMLVTAQMLQDKGLNKSICAVYTNGSNVAAPMLKWFNNNAKRYDFLLIRDPDDAGLFWEKNLKEALADGKPITLVPPDHKDPDDAFLNGWWPSGI